MPMPRSSIGECVPDVTSPPPSIDMPWRGTAFSSMTNGTSLRAGPSLLDPAQRLDAGELGVERARPAEPGGDRVGLGRDVVPVQRVADLEPQRVARAEPARATPRASTASQSASASSSAQQSSTPCSPV